MSKDILSDVLRSVRLRSAVFYFVSCEGDWVAVAPCSREIADAVMPDAEHLMEYHVVTAGECWVRVAGEPPLNLHRGDVIVLPQGDAHAVSSAPDMHADVNVDSYREMQRNQRPFHLHYADGSEPQRDSGAMAEHATTRVVCGFIGCDARPFNPLLSVLPRLLHLPATEVARSEQFAALAAEESAHRRPGRSACHVRHCTSASSSWSASRRCSI